MWSPAESHIPSPASNLLLSCCGNTGVPFALRKNEMYRFCAGKFRWYRGNMRFRPYLVGTRAHVFLLSRLQLLETRIIGADAFINGMRGVI